MRILVVGPAWVGDMVMAQSLFIALKQLHCDCQIDVLAPPWTLPLLAHMPEISQAIEATVARGEFGLMTRIRQGKQLRQNRYDQSIVLPNSWKSALAPFFANIPKRTGYIGEWRWWLLNDARRLNKLLLTQTVQRFVALAADQAVDAVPTCPTPTLMVDSNNRQKWVEQLNFAAEKKVLVLCPGAEYGEAKRWPVTHFAELARRKNNDGWQVWLMGSPKDQSVAQQINHLAGGACIDFTGKTGIGDAIDLLSLADIVVSNDSGLMHVASALHKNLIALYGSSDPQFTPPLSDKARILSLGLDCSPCFKRVCPLGHGHCLTGITAERVLAEIDSFDSP